MTGITNSIHVKLEGTVSRGIKAAEIDENGHLIFTLTDNSTVDLGKVVGDEGPAGEPGTDGYSPSVTITDIEGGHRVTITDEAHPQGQSFDVLDGQGGGGTGDHRQLTNRDAADQHPMSAITGLVSALSGKQATISDIAEIRAGAAAGATALQSESDPTVPAWAKQPTKPTYSKADVGLGNVDNVQQYSASNPPPYPVTSVNGKTGTVNLGAADVGAATEEYVDGEIAEATTDMATQTWVQGKGYITEAEAPLQGVTVNGSSIVEQQIAKIVYETGLGSDSSNAATVTAIRAFVNSSINSLAAYYITANAQKDAFATKAALDAGPWYYNGAVRTPTTNDYAIVIADETHGGNTARYAYTTSSWSYQYTFNMQFTAAQLAALTSGITEAKVALYDAHLASTANPHAVTKSQVGLGNVGNYKAVSTVANQGLSDVEKNSARANIGAGTSSFSGNYNDLSNKPTIPTVPTNVSAFTNDAGYLTQHQSLTAYRTASAQDAIDATKADKPTIKTVMDAVATVNTMYFLGTQSAVSIVLPSNANAGDQLSVVWYNGVTAASLTIQGSTGASVLDPGYSPSANSRSELNAMWDGTYWAVVTNEQAVPI